MKNGYHKFSNVFFLNSTYANTTEGDCAICNSQDKAHKILNVTSKKFVCKISSS